MKHFRISALALIALVTFSSCSSDDDAARPVNEEEVITTVTAVFSPIGGPGATVTLTSRDLDGDGPNLPVNTVSGPFMAGTTYAGTVTFLNELETPSGNITAEIMEEADEHQIFYTQTGGALGSFVYADTDGNGKPLGLKVNYTTAASAVTGELTITLKHEPNKSANMVSEGDITHAGGSTDARVTFDIVVE